MLISLGNTKGYQFDRCLNDWQIDPVGLIALGDNGNDMRMIQLAGVAMGNAIEPLQAVADYVTDDHDNEWD
ncbi:HAD family hydrolase [Celerinatantimonas diazotrophica]|uniref:HAD family hydrolase n=1 Tax=Celerinatantimonas diazotrophica TaxID=412034 RepID=UPI001CC5343C|nr:HAD hydrolase family protein [Celerinatantimonas diazotrophica]CAG9296389.1 Sugar phosphatase YbiV [Celerinatantimonas diazotrophica]